MVVLVNTTSLDSHSGACNMANMEATWVESVHENYKKIAESPANI